MDEMVKELRKPLDPKHVKPAPKGKFGDYVDGHHVLSEANRIFGEFGWSYSVTRLEAVSEQTVELKGQNGPYEQYRVGYLCTVRVEVGDPGQVARSHKEGVGSGSGSGSPLSMADHHESAMKEAETDALKRALRSYGNTFGLALYDKTHANVRAPEVERDPKAVAESLIKLIAKQTTTSGLDRLNSDGSKFFAALDWLAIETPDIAAQVNNAWTDKYGALDGADFDKAGPDAGDEGEGAP